MPQKQKKIQEIGIRELKARASNVIRAVKERRVRYVITQRGTPVAAIIPLDAILPEKNQDEILQKMLTLRKRIGAARQSGKPSVEILSEMRR
jgi:prevent-host-death family protein